MIVLAGGVGPQPGQGLTFLAPAWLWLFGLVGAMVTAYAIQQFLRRRYAVRFSTLTLLRSVAPRRPGWRRHLAATSMFFCLSWGIIALARPAANVRVPTQVGTVMVAIDVSLSMQSTDIKPTRLRAAESAATDFVNGLPRSFYVGLVSFSRVASVLVPPTQQHDLVVQGISELQLADSTAIGAGIIACLQAIKMVKGQDDAPRPPAAIVLLSDGATNTGPTNDQAATDARAQGVPVSTVALGTPDGTVTIDGQTITVPVDGPALQRIAQQTGGDYFRSTSAGQLQAIYQHLRQTIGFKTEAQELTAYFIGLAVLFGFLCAAGSLLWQPRIL